MRSKTANTPASLVFTNMHDAVCVCLWVCGWLGMWVCVHVGVWGVVSVVHKLTQIVSVTPECIQIYSGSRSALQHSSVTKALRLTKDAAWC